MYRFGIGVPQDDAEAFAWFLRAGKGGHAEAQTVLGFLHAYGVGTQENIFQAYFWFSLAATQANPAVAASRDKMARSLSAAQRAEVDRLVADARRETKVLSRGPTSTPVATLPVEPEAVEATDSQNEPAAAPTTSPSDFRIQLGAFLIAENAPALWRRLRAAQPDLLGGLRPRVQRADRGGRAFHLLQAGPRANTEGARGLCAALTARGVDCLVVKP
jgi:TPR repeat protein